MKAPGRRAPVAERIAWIRYLLAKQDERIADAMNGRVDLEERLAREMEMERRLTTPSPKSSTPEPL